MKKILSKSFLALLAFVGLSTMETGATESAKVAKKRVKGKKSEKKGGNKGGKKGERRGRARSASSSGSRRARSLSGSSRKNNPKRSKSSSSQRGLSIGGISASGASATGGFYKSQLNLPPQADEQEVQQKMQQEIDAVNQKIDAAITQYPFIGVDGKNSANVDGGQWLKSMFKFYIKSKYEVAVDTGTEKEKAEKVLERSSHVNGVYATMVGAYKTNNGIGKDDNKIYQRNDFVGATKLFLDFFNTTEQNNEGADKEEKNILNILIAKALFCSYMEYKPNNEEAFDPNYVEDMLVTSAYIGNVLGGSENVLKNDLFAKESAFNKRLVGKLDAEIGKLVAKDAGLNKKDKKFTKELKDIAQDMLTKLSVKCKEVVNSLGEE